MEEDGQEWQIDPPPSSDALMILLPMLIILSTLLFLLLLFLVSVILLRKRRGIALRDGGGPVDLTTEESIEADGGFETIEANWLEAAAEDDRREYTRAKEWQAQYPPNSQPTDITLSQFLSIQEKGVSAWSFEPDYETMAALLVHSRTEITFLPDPPFASTCVQSNLPLPKLNEVYYWEVKMFDLPQTSNVAIGLATKPYPTFRLPGLNRFSVAYHSNGDKSHNHPFNSVAFGTSLKEGDVIGVGYRPRHGTVFFTRNGRKTEDAFTGLSRWNLFPTVGANGPCSLHVNFGQAGFVFIEANVKKWGLAPMVGTLAPPPAYGSERGSILLAAGGQTPPQRSHISQSSNRPARSARRSRRQHPNAPASAPAHPSPLSGMTSPPRDSSLASPVEESEGSTSEHRYVSPTDVPPFRPNPPSLPSSPSGSVPSSRSLTPRPEDHGQAVSAPESPIDNPPTPHHSDIHLQSLPPFLQDNDTLRVTTPGGSVRQPPDYSPLDPYQYSEGVHLDLPADMIQAALEGTPAPQPSGRSQARRSGRRS